MEKPLPAYRIAVVRADGRRVPIAVQHDDFGLVCGQALDKAQWLAIHGCPFGDPQPPRCVRVTDAAGRLVLRIAIGPSLIPRRPDA